MSPVCSQPSAVMVAAVSSGRRQYPGITIGPRRHTSPSSPSATARSKGSRISNSTVGTGRPTSILQFAELLRAAYGAKVEPSVPGQYRPMDFRHLTADNRPLRAIGWQPTVSVEEGVRRYADWILSMKRPAEYFTKAEEALKRARVVRQAK